MRRFRALSLLAVIALVFLALRPWAIADGPKNVQRIAVDEIGRSVQLIGRLGAPLGEKIEISGYWHFPKAASKDSSIRFTVTAVNGRMLTEPAEFNHEQLDFRDNKSQRVIPPFAKHRDLENQSWTLIAYETGRIQLSPDEYQSKSPVFPIAGMPYYTKPFTSEVVGVLQRHAGGTKP